MRALHRRRLSIVFCVSALVLSHAGTALFAGPRKDVSDPVLQEILASFESRMPRFIERHGKDLFVTDEPITRGSLMQALYEYDKSLRIPRKDFVTQQEFEELKSRVAQNTIASSAAQSGRSGTAKVDVMEIINDLQPNMPILLDNSLESSKVFNSLKQEVMNRSAGNAAPAAGRSGVELTRADIAELEKRMDRIEKESALNSRYASQASAPPDAASRQELSELRSKLALLERNMAAYRAPAREESDSPKIEAKDIASKQDLNELKGRLAQIEKNVSSMGEAGTGGGGKEAVSRQEISDIRAKLASLERNAAAVPAAGKDTEGVSRQEMNDIRAKLASLERGMATASTKEGARGGEKDLASRKELKGLDDRLAQLERSMSSLESQGGESTAAGGDVNKKEFNEVRSKLAQLEKNMDGAQERRLKKEIEETRQEIAKIERRVNELGSSSGPDEGREYAGEAQSYSTLLTRISLGLSMVAALFIAR